MTTDWIEAAVKDYYSSIEKELKKNMHNDKFRVTYKYLDYVLTEYVEDIWQLYQLVHKIKDVFEILKKKGILSEFVRYDNFRLWFNNAYDHEKICLVRKNVNIKFNSAIACNSILKSISSNSDKRVEIKQPSIVDNRTDNSLINGVEVPVTRKKEDFPEAYLPSHLYHFTSSDPRYPEFFPERITDKDGNRCRWLAKVDFLLIDDEGYLYIPEEQLPLPFNLSPTYDAGLYQKADRAEFFDVEKIKALIRKASTKVPDGIFKGRNISL